MIQYLSKIINLDKLNVVGVIKNDNEASYYVLTVQKNGSKITILSKRFFSNFTELASKIETKLPIIIVIDGKGVLNKRVDFNNETDINWLKNIDFNTIYFTSIKSEQSNFISFSRKNNVEDTIAAFQKANFQIIDLYVGSFLSALLYGSIQKEAIVSGSLLLHFQNDILIDFSKNEIPKKEMYVIGNDDIANDELPLYGALVHFFLQNNEVEKTKNATLNSEEIIYKKAFNFFGIGILAFFFGTLLISYMLQQYYGTKNAALNLQNVYSGQSYKQLKALETQKERQLAILNQSGLTSSKFLTNYVYDLVKDCPPAISLTEINTIPADKEVKLEKKISFESSTILIKGETFEEASISNWLERLKKINWIKKFEIISLKKDKKSRSQFEIKISIR